MRGKKDFSGKTVLGKARVYKELMFGNRIRNIQGVMECISMREGGSRRRSATVDGHENDKERLCTVVRDYE